MIPNKNFYICKIQSHYNKRTFTKGVRRKQRRNLIDFRNHPNKRWKRWRLHYRLACRHENYYHKGDIIDSVIVPFPSIALAMIVNGSANRWEILTYNDFCAIFECFEINFVASSECRVFFSGLVQVIPLFFCVNEWRKIG